MKYLCIRLFVFFFITILGALADLGTKSWIFDRLGEPGLKEVWWIVPQFFGFETSLNQGALFGIGQGKILLFVIMSVVALVFLLLFVIFEKEKNCATSFIFGLISAGIIGNLWDRLGLHQLHWTAFQGQSFQCPADQVGEPIYAVRDWILFKIGDFHWPNFNLADSFLVLGAGLIFLVAMKETYINWQASQHKEINEDNTANTTASSDQSKNS